MYRCLPQVIRRERTIQVGCNLQVDKQTSRRVDRGRQMWDQELPDNPTHAKISPPSPPFFLYRFFSATKSQDRLLYLRPTYPGPPTTTTSGANHVHTQPLQCVLIPASSAGARRGPARASHLTAMMVCSLSPGNKKKEHKLQWAAH